MPSATPKLFQPFKLGNLDLQHRIVLAPLTRLRTTVVDSVPVKDLVKEYYTQRSKIPGTFLISEAAAIAPKASGFPNLPGVWSEEQVTAWKEVVDAVHRNGSYIFLQIGAVGRLASPKALASLSPDPYAPYEVVGASAIPLASAANDLKALGIANAAPRPLTIKEIGEYVDLHVQAAVNGVKKAGFDGVEIHSANGTLLDQFLQDVTNQRTDEHGGSVEARSRFTLRVVDAVAKAIGPERTALRLSPWSTASGMGMADPLPQFSYLASELKHHQPDLAYLHVIDPRFGGSGEEQSPPHASNDFLRKIWAPKPYISAGGYTRETAIQAAEDGELIAFGRTFIANPDLPYRLRKNIELNQYDRSTFYTPGDLPGSERGYTDYTFSTSFLQDGHSVAVSA